MLKQIPKNTVQIQPGLCWELYSFTVLNKTHQGSKLYSREGYCFYDKNEYYYDEDGVIITDEEMLQKVRIYMQYCTTPETTMQALNERFISVPSEGKEVS